MTMHLKTDREVLQALIDGKRLRDDMGYVHLNADGRLVCVHPDRDWSLSHLLMGGAQAELFVAPNPHPAGSWNWALEELTRGEKVRQPWWGSAEYIFLEASEFIEENGTPYRLVLEDLLHDKWEKV